MDTETIWISIIVPLVIGPLCIFLKSIYDRFNKKVDDRILNNYTESLNRVSDKLKKFYWPVYLHLLCIYQFNFNIPLEDKELSSSGSSTSSSGSSCNSDNGDSSKQKFVKYTKKKLRKCKGVYKNKQNKIVKCRKYVPNNSFEFCRKCRWREPNIDLNSSNNLNSNLKKQKIDIKNEIKIQIPIDLDGESDTDKNIENEIKDLSITGSGIGIVKKLSTIQTKIDEKTMNLLKDIINKSHGKLVNIIESEISTAEPNSKLGKQLVLFIKYSKIRDIINLTDIDYKIKHFGVKDNTNKLLSLVEIKLFDLQKEYNILLRKGPYEYDTSDSSDSE
jgi:hypothetical protein